MPTNTFVDSAGCRWTVSLDGLTLKALRDAHQIDLADVAGAVYVQLERDPALLTQALAFLCADQMKEAAPGGLTAAQFSKRLVGQHLEQAFAALWGAAELFFPPKLWSALSSRSCQEKQVLEVRQKMQLLGLLDLPPELREELYGELGRMMHTSIGSLSLPAAPSAASGPEGTPPTPASS